MADRMGTRTLGLTLLLTLACATTGSAQDTPLNTSAPHLIVSDRAVAAGLASAAAAQQLRSDDSLKNGAVIGAVVGGIAMGAFGAYVCYITGEVGDPPCWPAILRIGALGAGLGAAAGAGIDALHARSGPLDPRRHRQFGAGKRVTFGVRTDGRRLTLSR
jgi:hypothetical protein